MAVTKSRKAPWRRANPKSRAGTSHKLTPDQKSAARAAAARSGRPYPNLVDNMNAAKSARSSSGKARRRTKDPKGGLTAAGRAEFRRRDGAHLVPASRKARAR